jgi:predicted metalloprotease with PDZ domain
MVFKPTPRAKLGLTFSRDIGSLSLASVQPNGLFANSIVNTGDKVLAINKIPCEHMQPTEAVAIAQKFSESVTILVRVSRRNGVVLSHKAGSNEAYRFGSPQAIQIQADRASRSDSQNCGAAMWFMVVGVLAVVIVSSM